MTLLVGRLSLAIAFPRKFSNFVRNSIVSKLGVFIGRRQINREIRHCICRHLCRCRFHCWRRRRSMIRRDYWPVIVSIIKHIVDCVSETFVRRYSHSRDNNSQVHIAYMQFTRWKISSRSVHWLHNVSSRNQCDSVDCVYECLWFQVHLWGLMTNIQLARCANEHIAESTEKTKKHLERRGFVCVVSHTFSTFLWRFNGVYCYGHHCSFIKNNKIATHANCHSKRIIVIISEALCVSLSLSQVVMCLCVAVVVASTLVKGHDARKTK